MLPKVKIKLICLTLMDPLFEFDLSFQHRIAN